MRKLTFALVAFVAFVPSAFITTPAGATLTTCQPMISGVGRGPTAAIAFNKAVKNWRHETGIAYGEVFVSWSNAQERGRSCKENGALIYCRVHAKPCLSGAAFDGGVNKKPVSGD
jgi:hypothetical protein